MFASSRHLHLEHVCTHGTPVKQNLGYLHPLPIAISFCEYYFRDGDADNLVAALEHRDLVQVIEISVLPSLFDRLAMAMQEPLPALTRLRLESDSFQALPILPDTILGGSAPRLQSIYIAGISFPAAPTLLSSARDLVYVDIRDIPRFGFIPPEAMVASLAALPKLESFTFAFQWGMSYHDRTRMPSNTWTILPALIKFAFDGPFEYFEDFVAQIDAPQLNNLHIAYLDEDAGADFQIPQLCKFIDRSEKLRSSRFRHAELTVESVGAIIELLDGGRSSFRLSILEDAIGEVVNQLSALLTDVDRLFIDSVSSMMGEGDENLGVNIQWLEVFRPFTSLKALSVDDELSSYIPPAFQSVISERTAEVLPALNLLRLKNSSKLTGRTKRFIAARQNVGRPVTVVSDDTEFRERLRTA